MTLARRGGGAVGASARALLALLLFLVVLIGCRGALAIRVLPHGPPATGGRARNRSHSGHSHGGGGSRVAALPRKAMPLPGTRPVPVRLAPAGSAEEESKRRIPSCPDPLHNR